MRASWAGSGVVLGLMGLIVAWTGAALASPTFTYSFDQANAQYQVDPNVNSGQVTVTVYLESTDAAGSAMLSAGMLSGGVKLSYTSGDYTVQLNSYGAITGNNTAADSFNETVLNGNPQKYLAGDITAQDPSAVNPIAGIAEFRGISEITGATGETDPNNGFYRIELGKFTFSMVDLNNWTGTNTITASNLFPDLSYNVTFGGENLENTDPLAGNVYGVNSASFVIEVVPEPPGVVTLVGLGASGALLGVVQWWRRKRANSGPAGEDSEEA